MKTQHYQVRYTQKGFVVPLIIAIIALLAVGGYAYEKQKASKQSTVVVTTESTASQTQTTNEVQTSVSTTNQMSLKDLLSLASPQDCTTTFTANGVETHGTVKVAQGKVRADYETTVNGKTWNVHALLDGSNSYTWMDGMPQGFKVALSTDGASASSKGSQGADVNQKMNVVCTSWNVDTTVLSLPANVSFMTIGGQNGVGNVTVPAGVPTMSGKAY